MLILAAVTGILVYGMIAAMLGTILPDLSKRFNLTPAQNGTIALAQAFGLIIASVSVGPLIDSQGKKVALVLGLGLISLALFLLPRSKGYSQVVMFLFVLGLGGGIIVTGANSLVADVKDYPLATVSNFLNLFFGLGGLLTPFVSANLLGRDSVKLCYLVAFLTVITLAINAVAPMPGPSNAGAEPFAGAGRLLSSPALWLLSLFLFLYVASEVGVWNWLARHLVAQGIPESKALNILSLGFALGLLVGRVAVSPLFQAFAPEQVTLASAILMAITTFLMLRTTSPTAAGLIVFGTGIAMAPVFPTTLAIVGTRFPNNATALGLAITFGWIGLAVSSRIIGSIAGEDPRRLRTALLVLPAAAVAMVVVNLVLQAYPNPVTQTLLHVPSAIVTHR